MQGKRFIQFEGSLPDILPTPGGILLIGINPSPVSVEAGHYYQGRLGKRLWGRLAKINLLRDTTPGAEDEAFARAGHGLTDIVMRPSPSANDLAHEEFVKGAASLRGKTRAWKPGLILFSFKEPAVRLIGKKVQPGVCGEIENVPAFLLSGPYAPSTVADRIDRELIALLGRGPKIAPSPTMKRFHLKARPIAAARTQRITAVDIGMGRIRLPRSAKRHFPSSKSEVMVVLHGKQFPASYNPRAGPDRERSAVLSFGRRSLQSLVRPDEILQVVRVSDGTVHIG